MIDQRLKIAVFIDFDNIEIGVKTTLHTQFDIAAILDGIKERGEVVTKVAYGDWKRAGDYGRMMSQHAIRMVQRNLTPGGDKNGADINLALDALEMAFTHDHINAFVIVGGDSDFITLVEKLKQYDKKVFVVGGRQFTSQVMQKNCHEFIAYENLISAASRPRAGPRTAPRERRHGATAAPADVRKAIPLVKRALKVLTDREVSPQLGLLKSTLLQLDSTFSERDYGVSTFRDFIEKVAKTGLVTLRHSGRSMMVDAVDALDGAEPHDPSAAAPRFRRRLQQCRHRRRHDDAQRRHRRLRVGDPGACDPEQVQQIARSDARRVQSRHAAAALADVRAPAQAVHPRSRSDLRRAQMGIRDGDGVPARVPARGDLPARARSPRTDSCLSGLRHCNRHQAQCRRHCGERTGARRPTECLRGRPACNTDDRIRSDPDSGNDDSGIDDSGSVRLQPDLDHAAAISTRRHGRGHRDRRSAGTAGRKPRRTRKAPTAGSRRRESRPGATAAPRRRKTPVPA